MLTMKSPLHYVHLGSAKQLCRSPCATVLLCAPRRCAWCTAQLRRTLTTFKIMDFGKLLSIVNYDSHFNPARSPGVLLCRESTAQSVVDMSAGRVCFMVSARSVMSSRKDGGTYRAKLGCLVSHSKFGLLRLQMT